MNSAQCFIVTLVIVLAVTVIIVQSIQPPNCPAVKFPTNVDNSKLDGKFYVYMYSNSTVTMPDVKCMTRTRTTNQDGTISLHVESIDVKSGNKIVFDGLLTVDETNPLIFYLKDAAETHYLVGSDNNTFRIILNCLTVNGVQGYIVMLLTSRPETKISSNIRNALKNAGINDKTIKMDQRCSKS